MRMLRMVPILLALASPLFGDELQMFGTYFLAGSRYSSQLLIHNKRGDTSITVTPVVFGDGGAEIALDALTLRSKETASISIDAALAARNRREVSRGGVGLRYTFEDNGPVDAEVVIRHRSAVAPGRSSPCRTPPPCRAR